ncbi:uncharacterized protein MELLADRAFT_59868 [Melampsora larici-populina 98AG31]|uniref:Uncharacterized protein n=1 Tax=Melampsora larici-populina (strain 98AG31 / pathotype 3-4-7) TaxID=747676 RepID=F4R931_MELLP|nr:uncharacterized protein MELLADRAFT_59868 [Melampsora larici-populina 98AG31]EGG11227.1 hypothetical protein MELLADRAFT_59868 [Melampsora larici-populina 98AG31]
MSMRLQRERDSLIEEENAYRRQLENISGFGKNHIIPIGKLQRLDETDTESEPSSETERTNSPMQIIPGLILEEPTTNTTPTTVERPIRFRWNEEESQERMSDSNEMSGIDLDADVEDLDNHIQDEDGSEEIRYTDEVSEDQIEGDSRSLYEDELSTR